MKKPRLQVPGASAVLAEAIILAVDASKTCSGSVLLVPEITHVVAAPLGLVGKPYVRRYIPEHYCEVRTQAQHEDCVMHLVSRSQELGLCPIVAAETWTSGRWSHKAKLGMGEGWGWWTAELRRAQERIPELGVIYVEKVCPNDWRDDLFGSDRETDGRWLKQMAVWYVQQIARLTVPPDVAEGACVGYWAAQRKSVLDAVLKWQKRQARGVRNV